MFKIHLLATFSDSLGSTLKPPLAKLVDFKTKKVEYLKTIGQIIHGKVSKIYQDTSYIEHGEHPWRIAVRWLNPDSGKLHVFKSDYIWYNPSDFVKIGEEMEVRIDPKKPKKPWVNIDYLSKRED